MMLGPRNMGAGTYSTDDGRGAPPSSYQEHSSHNDTTSTSAAYGGIALTPAQRLIERYERMNTPPPQTPPPPMRNKSTKRTQYVYDYNASAAGPELDRYMGSKEKKKHTFGGGFKKESRSPIRQSLRNLLSVVKKGAGGLAKRKSDNKLALPVGAVARFAEEEHQFSATNDLEHHSAAPPGAAALSRPRKAMTGSLLYLTRGQQLLAPNIPSSLMWTTSNVTLESNKLVVSSFTSDMELYVDEVLLTRCSDIRSVSANQLSETEAALLDKMPDGDAMRAFEIIFDDGRREIFAAKSVRERAGWISAIWDGILPMQKITENPALQTEATDSVVIKPDEPTQKIPVESPIPTPLPQLSRLLEASYSDRSLPPLPPKSPLPSVAPLAILESKTKNPQHLHLDLSELQNPISPSIYLPTFQTASSAASTPINTKPQNLRVETGSLISPSTYPPTSRPNSVFVGSPLAVTPGSSCPNSPSIANLSQLSVVRNRLQQIERNHSELSAQSRPTSSRASTPTLSPLSASSRWSKREAVFHNSGARSIASKKAASPSGSIVGTPGTSPPSSYFPAEKRQPLAAVSPRAGTSRHVEHADHKDAVVTSKSNTIPSKDEIRELSNEIAAIKGILGGESGYPTIHNMVVGIEQHVKGDNKTLRNIQDSLTAVKKQMADVTSATSTAAISPSSSSEDKKKQAGVTPSKQAADILHGLQEVKDRLSVDFPALDKQLKEIKKAQEQKISDEKRASLISSNDTKTNPATDFQSILDGLNELRTSFKILSEKEQKEADPKDNKSSEHVEKILSLIQEDSNKQTLLAQQQADSVRYLNELNTWLEAFVNNGTSQIQGISLNIDRLCKEIGQDDFQPGLVNDIRQLIAGMKARDQNFAALQAAVHSLLEVLTASQTQRGQDSQAIAGLMNRQRHEQEVLFRAFTNEISDEIKGERLRFVEAMKEATAINVQIHVEQFKQELSREVMAMTEEVGRLHREKQTVENQISDLFSFYSKHKQADMPLQTIQENVVTPGRQIHERSGSRANIPRSNQRLLPYPR